MPHRSRLKYTDEMRIYIWDRYQIGDSIKSIGRSFDRPSSSIHNMLARTGGIRPPSWIERLPRLAGKSAETAGTATTGPPWQINMHWTGHSGPKIVNWF